MIVMAVDPGYVSVGVVVCNLLDVLFTGTVNLNGERIERIGKLVDFLREVIEKYRPLVVVMERVFYGKNVDSSLKLSEVRGAVLGLIHLYSIIYREYHPSEIKKMVTGNGRATKEQIRWMVERLFNFSGIRSHHESDALALIYTHLASEGLV